MTNIIERACTIYCVEENESHALPIRERDPDKGKEQKGEIYTRRAR